ncbi:branched-subunit amino acid permease [Microbacterium resistens]|uniref:Branched-subunit amino acid permease n=1 Tax=Microbacterium resistens TaxID=156977 RepID=A0ABU1SF00_9MICO|nr:hypothetical protein [Microbacterium resistens]MDR6868191.1 branched-subunit amino acid permease [Microbacterium resistens]
MSMRSLGIFWAAVAATVIIAILVAVLSIVAIAHPEEGGKLNSISISILPIMIVTMLVAILLKKKSKPGAPE